MTKVGDKRKTGAHLFKKGQSGNPLGRTKGYRSRNEWFYQAVRDRQEDIAQACVNLAVQGDAKMMGLVLDRMVAKLPPEQMFEFPEFEGDVKQKTEAVFAYLKDGKIGSGTALGLMQTIQKGAELTDLQEIKEQLKKLEEKIK